MEAGDRNGQSERAKDRKQPVAVAVEVEIAAVVTHFICFFG
jgi:hypothetical protein